MATVRMYFDEKNKNLCDIYINEQGMAELIEENEELAQELKDELESNMTQWYLGYTWGIKLIQDDGSGLLDKKNPTDDEIVQEIQRVISKHNSILKSEVLSVSRYDSNDTSSDIISNTMNVTHKIHEPSPILIFENKYKNININSDSARHIKVEIEIVTRFGKENLHVTLI